MNFHELVMASFLGAIIAIVTMRLIDRTMYGKKIMEPFTLLENSGMQATPHFEAWRKDASPPRRADVTQDQEVW
jgi:hypothetical protein